MFIMVTKDSKNNIKKQKSMHVPLNIDNKILKHEKIKNVYNTFNNEPM